MVDDARGVVLDVAMTEGTLNEREVIASQMEVAPPRGCPTIRKLSRSEPEMVTADSGYAYSKEVYFSP